MFNFSIPVDDLTGKRIALFSYGSGLASSMFSLRVSEDGSAGSSLAKLVSSLESIPSRLAARHEVEPEAFVATLSLREQTHHRSNYTPTCPVDDLFPGTFYLTHVDEKFRRSYSRRSNEDRRTYQAVNGSC